MNEALDKLQKIGAQEIHDATHIPIQYVKAILAGDFKDFSKIQFLGFISILEREYQSDLSELKKSALLFFDENSIEKPESVFVTPKKNNKNTFLYVSIVVVLFIIVLIFKANSNSEAVTEEVNIDNSVIESVVEEINSTKDKSINETNSSVESVKTEEINSTKEVNEEPIIEKSFTIIPRSKVWFGYIDVETNKKYQKTFSHELSLDPNKEWLLMFGHGYIDMYIDGKIQKFSNRGKVRFLYSDGEVRPISLKEFKQLNRGRKW